MKLFKHCMEAGALDFAPGILRIQRQPPSPLPRLVLYILLLLFVALLIWADVGRLDIIAVARGKLVPETFLQIVQPAQSGIVKEILVKEGDEVKAGQVLARMDMFESKADTALTKAELATKSLEIRRVEAELGDEPFEQRAGDPPELFAKVAAQYHANRKAYTDELDTQRAALKKAQEDLKGALEVEDKLSKTLVIYKEHEAAVAKLYKQGYVSKIKYLEQQRIRIETEQNLRAQRHTVTALKATITASKHRISQITSSYRQHLQDERVQLETESKKLRSQWAIQQHRHQLLELRAPQNGIIKNLSTHTPGSVVSPGTVLMTLVPTGVPLRAEVWVKNLDAGFVREGQDSKIKLTAYPFQRYGMLQGEVAQISPDSGQIPVNANQSDEAGRKALAPSAGYRTLITLDESYLKHNGHRYRLFPGMQITAEIHIGSRTILEYLLSPIQKIANEAAHER
jgi:HlyD family secretion protein